MSVLNTVLSGALNMSLPNVPTVPYTPWDDLINTGIDYLNQKYINPSTNIQQNLLTVTPTGGAVATTPQVTKGMLYDPNGNCGAGKWIKRRKRRRRRICTATDIKDLSALKGVLGGGKDFQLMIATRGLA